MPYEVCYRALLSISVVEGLKPHTRDATSKTPDLRVRPTGSASGGARAPRYGQLRGRSVFNTLSLFLPFLLPSSLFLVSVRFDASPCVYRSVIVLDDMRMNTVSL